MSRRVVLCDWQTTDAGVVCRRCGVTLPRPQCMVCDRSPSSPPAGLGDWTESLLESLGVTKERYVAAKQLFGLAPTCNCEERKAWLNNVSEWLNTFTAQRRD